MTVPLSRRRAGARNGARLAEAAIATEKDRQQDERDREAAASKERRRVSREAERDRVRLTRDDIAGATHVRTDTGWRRVITVNAKSVAVATAYSWTDRIPFERVLEVRTVKQD